MDINEDDEKALVELHHHKDFQEIRELPKDAAELQDRVSGLVGPPGGLDSSSAPSGPYQYYEPPEGTGGLPAVKCTCGWEKRHLRFKVLEIASKRHFAKSGHNTERL